MGHESVARRLGLAIAAAVCLLGAPSARAEDPRLRELDAVLAALEDAPTMSGSVSLAPLVAELEKRDASRRSEFAAAESRKLSGKAADRLARARRAYEAGHGRLLQLLRSLQANAAKPAGQPAFDRASAIREAREILARIAKASEPEPISTTRLSVAAPVLLPLLGQGAPSADRPIDAIPETLKSFAATLDGPVAVYEWVRNNVRPDFYYGVLKGPVQAYLEQSANDADTASLLIALFRAKGVPARYARATVEVPAATLQSMTGTSSVAQAVRVLERAGVPHEVVLGASAVSAVRMERVWAEVYLAYANYRGTSLDAQGKVWVPLDPGFKHIGTPGGIDVVADLGLDPRETLDAYLSGPQDGTPLEYLRGRVGTLVAEQRPGTPYTDVLTRRDHILEMLGLLPSSVPYRPTARPDVAFELPDTLRHSVRLVGEADTPLIDVTLSTADVLGRRLTLSYVPASDEDAALAKSYGGIARTPPYLIEVRPVIKMGGVEVAVGSGPIGMGVRFTFRIELRSPGGTQVVTNNLIAGNLTAIGLGGREVTATEADQDQAAQILSRLAWTYLDKWNQSDAELSRLLRVVPVRPTVSTCLVMSDIQVDYAGGDPLYPITFDWRGLAIDADHRATAPVGLESLAEEKAFLLMSGLEGSVLEHRIFEEDLAVASVSTAKGLGLAHAQGIEIADLTSSNADTILATLPFDLAVKDDIRQATARGLLARVPTAPLVAVSWRGVPYLLLDEETGEAAYQLQGGRSGGVTVATVIDFPAVLRDTLELQGETPAPETSDVARIQKFGTTDFQEGTVNQRLGRSFKVLVTDRDGFPVRNARVTFSIMGGGGELQDLATGITRPTDLDVFSDARGEAQARLILGKRTDVIPRFVHLEGDEFSTQVGVNLVTARAGNATLSEPFTAIAFPDEQDDGQLLHATFFRLSDTFTDGLFNLRVAGRLGVSVRDQFGNPLSNWPTKFTAISPALQGTPPVGYSLYDGPTTTPGLVLKTADYVECLKRFVNPGWGDCTGEASSVTVNSSSQGAFAYAVVGDSTYSTYVFHVGPVLKPDLLSFLYGTWGHLCHGPDASFCRDSSRPDMFVAAGSRPVRVNRLGNNIEAYPLGGDAQAVFWADVVIEKERVERTVDEQGRVHYHAIGTNQWRRERLTDSQFVVSPLTPGTQATAATHIGEGNYASVVTMGDAPQLNVVRADAKHFPPDIKYLAAGPGDPNTANEIDPAYVDDATLTVRRVKDTARPWQGSVPFSLWGVDADLTRLQPSPVLLDRGGAVSRTAAVDHRIAPDAFRELLEPTQVVFDLKRDGAPVVSATGSSAEAFQIPAGLPLPGGGYTAQLSVLGLTESGGAITSEPFPVPTCNLLDLRTPKLFLNVTRDVLNGATCGEQRAIEFVVCRDAVVTLTVDGAPVTGAIDGSGTPLPLTSVPLAAGAHKFWLSPDVLGVLLEKSAPFVIAAIDQGDPLSRDAAEGTVVNPIRNRSVLPVGHTFVKGVDLLDGHVVQQSSDLAVAGRHLGLDVTRTYSSAGRSSEGVMGAGWAFNYASNLVPGDCGLVNVSTADGSSQVFRTIDGGNTFTPQKGYHTRLVKLADGSYDFVDKAGTRHHFREPEDPTDPNFPNVSRRLEYIEEPHGDRIVPTYDSAGRVAKVAEVQRGGLEVRSLVVTYTKAGGFDRIAKVTAPGLALEVSYGYDAFGNLTTVTRSGANVAGPSADGWTKRYEYRTTISEDRHQLVAAVDPNGNRTEYVYYTNEDVFLGADEGVTLPGNSKQEYVKEVREFPGPGITQSTRFSYDYRDAATLKEFKTTVRDGRGNDSRYVMNPGGSPLRIEEPLGKTTRMVWSDTDVLKLAETDALGRVTEYGYDERGNLTSERVLTADLGAVETTYAYDPAFNKLTFKRDAEGRETRYVISGEGDLRSTTDAVGNVTGYDYDDEGRLTSVTDPRGHATSHSDHDSFGHARTMTDPLGNVTTRAYDPRGRLSHETDTLGHDAATVYDGLDRPITVTRAAGGASADEVNRTEYFAGGEVKATTNPLGARTVFTLDGLNRVAKTSVVLAEDTLITQAEYDANGNKTSETDRRGVVRRMTYDALNRLTKVEIVGGLSGEGPVGQISAFTYDLAGNKDSETNVAGLVTRFGFDGLYRVIRKALPEVSPSSGAAYTELFAYDRVGNRTSVTDANGHATLRSYDGLNRVVRTENALGHVVTATFADPEGSKVNKAEERDTTRGLRTTFAYDLLNRETQRKLFLEGAGSAGEVYTTATAYDDPAHTVTVTDARGTRTRTTLDGLDHPVTVVVDVDGLALTTRTTYDGLGNRTEVVDPRQASTRFVYDSLGRLRTMTDALVHSASYRYDGGGLKIRETDRRGVERQVSYDNFGRPRVTTLVASISGVGSRREVVYDDRGRKRTEIDARSHPTVANLDGLDRVVRVTDARNGTVVTRWDGVNRREETDKRGHTTKFDYDELNRPVRVTDPAPLSAQTVETTYLDAQNRVSVKDRRGAVTVSQMDPLGRTLTVTRAGITQETNAYDQVGNKTSAKDGEGKETRFTYDAVNRLSERTDGFGTSDAALTTYKYDANGNRTEELDARLASLGVPWSMRNTYDALNRLETTTDGEADVTRYGYDEEGNRISVVEPEQQETTYAYDELGKLLRVVQPGNRVTSYQYDPNRNRVLQTDANGHEVRMTYDELDRLDALVQDPSGLAFRTSHAYDANGNETVLIDPKGQTVTSTYDELNRLKTKAYAYPASDPVRPWRHTTSIAYAYDANGNLTRIEDSVASGTDPPSAAMVTTREYDDLDRLLSETSPLPDGGSRTVAYTYFANGTRKTVTGPSGETSSYTYDGQNRLATATTAGGVTSYAYFPDDLLRSVTYPSGVTATHAYDKADRLTSLVNARGATTLSSFTYGYDRNGNRLSQVEVNGGPAETTRYTYDALNRLETVTYPVDTNYPAGRVVTYGLDDVGNRTRETERTTPGAVLADKQGVFDNLNRLTTLTDLVDGSKTTTFTWDANGNQRTKTIGAVTTEYRYDCRDRLVEVVEGASTPGRFQYDFAGRRSKKIGSDGVVQYVYDQTSVLAEFDGSAVPVAKYEYGSDRLISMSRTGGSGGGEGRRWYSLDGLRSVVNLTDDAGSIVASYHLDAWGNFRFPTELGASRNRFAFTGYEWDPELGLFHAKARYFDPQIGRFTSQDSFLGQIDDPPSLHRYVYGHDRPTFFVDPTGHEVRITNSFTIDGKPLLATATDETTVYANPTNQQLTEQVDRGDITRAEAVFGQVRNQTRALATTIRDFEKSYALNFAEETVGNIAETVAAPGLTTYEGLAQQDLVKVGSGTLQTAVAGAIPLVVREGAPAVIGAAVEKAPWLAKDLREIAGNVAARGKAVLEGATKELTERLPFRWTENPGANLGNLKLSRGAATASGEASAPAARAPIRSGERTTFEDFKARSRVGDELEGHELLQHAFLKQRGLATTRLSTEASRKNPVLALPRPTHIEVNKAQAGIDVSQQNALQNIGTNAGILRDVGIARRTIQKLTNRAIEHARNLGLID